MAALLRGLLTRLDRGIHSLIWQTASHGARAKFSKGFLLWEPPNLGSGHWRCSMHHEHKRTIPQRLPCRVIRFMNQRVHMNVSTVEEPIQIHRNVSSAPKTQLDRNAMTQSSQDPTKSALHSLVGGLFFRL